MCVESVSFCETLRNQNIVWRKHINKRYSSVHTVLRGTHTCELWKREHRANRLLWVRDLYCRLMKLFKKVHIDNLDRTIRFEIYQYIKIEVAHFLLISLIFYYVQCARYRFFLYLWKTCTNMKKRIRSVRNQEFISISF